ncbi:MAG TPA: cation diffusion facilitator family transporter [Verrucomicrobiae bacterium]|nr:cation diffusion facilitator family transporter [Verrucomicrobiae bacterium]
MSASRLQRSLRATFVGMAVNFFLALAKFVAGFLGHSHALVADATESLADVFTSLAVWRGTIVAAEPPDEDHPYGHGKAEPLAAACVAGMMLFAAGWIMIKAFTEVSQPHEKPAAFTLGVLVAVVAVKEILFHFVRHEGHAAGNVAVGADAQHHRSDAITSFAAGIGITISLLGGKGYETADDWAAIAAACVIAWNGWRQLRPALNELMDIAPDRKVRAKIRQLAETVSGVARVEKCVVRKMGHQLYVDMHVEVDPQMTVLRSHEIAHDVKDKIRAAMPAVNDVLIHIEPLGIAAPRKKN